MVTCVAALLLPVLMLMLAWWGWLVRRAQLQRGLPPGPKPLPLLGNLLQLQSGHLDRVLMEVAPAVGRICEGAIVPRREGRNPGLRKGDS